mmetsp:Transcript_14666/g.35377  ORF Transcript_14666/g.35377 Transcript_14666/m.35377 type:complete len:269 (+) Transcript_14666:6818-7624(+)
MKCTAGTMTVSVFGTTTERRQGNTADGMIATIAHLTLPVAVEMVTECGLETTNETTTETMVEALVEGMTETTVVSTMKGMVGTMTVNTNPRATEITIAMIETTGCVLMKVMIVTREETLDVDAMMITIDMMIEIQDADTSVTTIDMTIETIGDMIKSMSVVMTGSIGDSMTDPGRVKGAETTSARAIESTIAIAAAAVPRIESTRILIEKTTMAATKGSGRRGAQLGELIPPANDVTSLFTTILDSETNFDTDYFNMKLIVLVPRPLV